MDNVGYAIPSSTVVKSLNDLKEYGYIRGRARLGVTVDPIEYSYFGYKYMLIRVNEISAGGSAAKSDLKVGDILYKCEGVNITSYEVLSQMLTKYSIDDTVKLTILRPEKDLDSSNFNEYLSSAKEIEIEITFVEFNPNA